MDRKALFVIPLVIAAMAVTVHATTLYFSAKNGYVFEINPIDNFVSMGVFSNVSSVTYLNSMY